jgi:hypothetical protein
VRRIAALDHERLPDLEVVDEGDLLPSLRRVVHARDDGIAFLGEQRRDDPVEAGVVEACLDAHAARDVCTDVDIRALGGGRSGLVRLLGRVGDIAAESKRARALDRGRRGDRRPATCGGRGRRLRALTVAAAARHQQGNEDEDDAYGSG